MTELNHGKTLIELAIMLPFVAALILGGADALTSLRRTQYLSVITRELGNAAFRSCRERPQGKQTEVCLKNTAHHILELPDGSAGILPGAEVVVTVYAYNEIFPDVPIVLGSFSSGIEKSKVPVSRVAKLVSYNESRGTVVISEAFFSGTAFSPWFSGRLYEITVF